MINLQRQVENVCPLRPLSDREWLRDTKGQSFPTYLRKLFILSELAQLYSAQRWDNHGNTCEEGHVSRGTPSQCPPPPKKKCDPLSTSIWFDLQGQNSSQ